MPKKDWKEHKPECAVLAEKVDSPAIETKGVVKNEMLKQFPEADSETIEYLTEVHSKASKNI